MGFRLGRACPGVWLLPHHLWKGYAVSPELLSQPRLTAAGRICVGPFLWVRAIVAASSSHGEREREGCLPVRERRAPWWVLSVTEPKGESEGAQARSAEETGA